MKANQVVNQSKNSNEFEIRRAYNKGANAMFEFFQDWLKTHENLPKLSFSPKLEGDLHIFWKKFHEEFD